MITMTITASDPLDLYNQLRYLTEMATGGATAPVDIDPDPTPKKPRKAPVAAPVAAPEPVEEEIEVDIPDTPPKLVEADNTKALLKLKKDTMDTLHQAYIDGKVKKVRALLESHGGGAKSWLEMAPDQFPEIAEAIEQGALR